MLPGQTAANEKDPDVRSVVRPYPTTDSRLRDFTIIVALGAATLLGLNVKLGVPGLTTGTVVVVALIPVWMFTLREFRFAVPLMGFAGATLAWGAVLHQFNEGRPFDTTLAIEVGLLFVTGMGGVGLLLWARTVLPLHWVVYAFAGGYLLGVLPEVPGSDNFWKFQVSVPLTLLLLAWATRIPGTAMTVLILGLVGVTSIAFDARSYFGFCLLAIVLVLWQRRGGGTAKKTSKLATLGLLGIAVVALYFVGSTLLVDGYLGEEAQARTVEQISESGSLLTSGRPEWMGTLRLMSENPMGFGLGTQPTSDDVWAAKEGMVAAGLKPDDGYIEVYMFGGHIKLHSITADLWASFGIAGFILAIAIVAIFVYCFLEYLGRRIASGLICMATIIGVWDMAFGPIYSNLKDVMIALAIVIPASSLAARSRRRTEHHVADTVEARPTAT